MATTAVTHSAGDGAGTTTESAAAVTAADAALTTFPSGDCGARLDTTDIVQEHVFAEFKEANRTIDDLPHKIILMPPKRAKTNLTTSPSSPISAGMKELVAGFGGSSAIEVLGGVPIDKLFEKDLSELYEDFVPEVEVKQVAPLLNARGGAIKYSGGTAHVTLDDNAVADLSAGRSTVLVGDNRRKGMGTVALKLTPPTADAATKPLQNTFHVGPADGFIRSPYLPAEDGSAIRVDLTAHQLKALRDDGEAAVKVNGQNVTLRASDEAPVQAQYAAEIGTIGAPSVTVPMPPAMQVVALGPGVFAQTVKLPKVKTNPATKLRIALYMPWRHIWRLKGYTRGELLHALALAPQEDVTIEVSTWDRRKRATDEMAESEFEQSKEFTETQKDSSSVVKDVANQSSFGINIGGSVGFNKAGFDVHGTHGSDARTSLNNASKTSLEMMTESVRKSAMKLRLERQTKVSETSEIGTEQKTSRRIRNANMCHTLLLNYYEVLAHYDIEISFKREEARLCVLVDNASLGLQWFDYDNIRYYESVLKRVLLVRDVERGFEAAHRLVAQDQLCEARRRNDVCSGVTKLATTEDADEKALIAQVQRAVNAYKLLQNATSAAGTKVLSPWSILSGAFGLPGLVMTLALDLSRVIEFQRWLYLRRARQIQPHLFDLLDELTTKTITHAEVRDVVDALGTIADLNTLKPTTMANDGDTLYKILREEYAVLPMQVFTDIPTEAYAINDAGVLAALNTLREMVADLAAKDAAKQNVDMMAENQAAALAEMAAKDTAADLEAVEALKHHLNEYRNYYRAAIFQLMPWSDQFQEMLRTFYPLVGREVLGFSGSDLALPLNLEADDRLQDLFDELITNNTELLSMSSKQSVTLPTSGVHMENRLGRCTGCEEQVERMRGVDLAIKRADLHLKREKLEQQKLETKRRNERIAAKDYSDPVRRPPLVRIREDHNGAGPPGPPPAPAPPNN